MRREWERETQPGQRLLGKPPGQGELRGNVKRPASDEFAGTGACGKRGDAAAGVQQAGRRGSQAAELAMRSNRNVEGREAVEPLRELNAMGEGIRDAVVFSVCYLLIEIDDAPLDGMPFSSCAPPP